MSIRFKTLLIIGVLILLSLALVACERERPVATPVPTVAPRGTVAPSPTAPVVGTVVTLPTTTVVTGTQTTTGAAVEATPTAPVAQQVVVSPGGQTGAEGSFFIYTVVTGDYLAGIAARYNTTTEAIVALNAMTDPDALVVGQQLKIPGTAPAGTGTTTTTGNTSVYVVQGGDTLAAIARRFGTTVTELVQLNNLANPDSLAIGQQLKVPATGGGTTAPTPGATSGQQRTHVVASGDTLLSIARSYGVTVQAIQAANNIVDPDRIYPGQVLVIP